MATYYVNLNLAGTGGTGTGGDPWHRDTFIAQINGLQPAGTVFKIYGIYEFNTAITIKCPGDNNSVVGYTLTNWGGNIGAWGSWAISSTYAGTGFILGNNSSGYHARNIISNCILNANSISCYDAVGLYGSFITVLNDINILGTSSGGTGGTSYIKGSTIASTNSKGLVLSTDTYMVDSIVYSPLAISPTAGTFSSRNCVFKVAPSSGSHINYQIGWSGTTIPVWSNPLASYNPIGWGGTLQYSTVGSPPAPGYGIYNYTDYSRDLSGQSRLNIGSYSLPANVYLSWIEDWPQVKNIAANAANMSFKFKSDSFPAVGFFVILPRNAYAPTIAQIQSGKDSLNNSVPYGFYGYQSMISGDTEYLLTAVNLSPATAYDAYFRVNGTTNGITYMVQFQTLEATPYYVNLDLTGTGGTGTVADPWRADTFATQVNGLQPAGTIFQIKGSHEYTSVFTVKCPGTDSSTIGYTFTNWDGTNPWRISVARGASPEIIIGMGSGSPNCHARNIFKNGILNAVNFYIECYDAAEFYDCYLKMSLYLYIYGTSVGGTGGNTIIKGSTIVSTAVNTYGIRTQYPNAITNLYDSIISAPLSISVSTPATLTSRNCTFVTTPTSGTHTNYQYGWTPPSWPVWDASKELFAKSLLNYSSITSPPSPGIGFPDYTGYPTNPWNQTRNNLGAYYDPPAQITSDSTSITVTFGAYKADNPTYPTFYYVDINNDYTTMGIGTQDNPYNYSQFLAVTSATFRLRGSRNLDSTALIRGSPSSVGNVEAWDPLLYGPWRIKTTSYFNYSTGQIVPGYLSGGIVDCLYASVTLRVMSNMFINTQEGLTFQTYNGGAGRNVDVYGSTFNCNTDMTAVNNGSIFFNDCIFDSSFNGTVLSNGTYNNCVFSMADWSGGTRNNCQFSWTPPTWPPWNSPKEFFYKSNLNFSTIATPPQPGYGYPDYAGVYFSDYGIGNFPGYNLNLWGNVRDGIGIFYSDPNPLDGTTLAANLPKLNFQGTGCTIKIQDVGKQERAVIFQKGNLNLGTNTCEIFAANDSTFQYNNLFYGSYDMTCGALRVGTDALKSDFSLYNGLGNYSIKAYDGSTHNATGKFTEYFQKSKWDCSGNWSFGSRHSINYIPGNCYVNLRGDATLTSNGKFFNFVEINAPDSTVTLNDNFKCHAYKKTVGTLNANGKRFDITGDFQSPVNF